MSTGFDPDNDFAQVVDGLLAVRFERPGTSIAAEVTHALSRPTQLVRVERSDGQYTVHDLVWHLPVAELPVTPQPGDRLVVEGEHWTVLAAQATALGRRWRCVCRNLVALWGLDQFIDVQEAVYQLGPHGDERPSWRTCHTGVRAKLQPLSATTGQEHERTTTVSRYRVYCAEPLELSHCHRLRGPDGTIYQILRVQKAERFDAMLEIEVEQRP